MRLIIQSVQLAPNDTVALQLRRGRNIRNVRVVTEPQRTVTYWRQPAPGSGADEQMVAELEQRFDILQSKEPMIAEAQGALPRSLFLTTPDALASLQLAPLNAELGQYFGISDGILVISVPKNSGLRLRGGDVILRVDGRTPAQPVPPPPDPPELRLGGGSPARHRPQPEAGDRRRHPRGPLSRPARPADS